MPPEALAHLPWILLSANGLEQTMLLRLLERQKFTLGWRGRPDRGAFMRIAAEAAREPRGAVVSLGADEARLGLHQILFRILPQTPLILFLRDATSLPEPLRLPANVVGTLDPDASEELCERALFLIRMGYGVLPQRALQPRRAPNGTGWPAPIGHGTNLNGQNAPHGAPDAAPTTPLTPREREVAWWICRGRSNKEIARALGVSCNTVNAHAGAIRRKLRARNRTEVAMHLAASTSGASP